MATINGKEASDTEALGRRVRVASSHAGTRLGFWVHFSCMSAATSFAVLWGHPYLVEGAGFSTDTASVILMIGVVVAGVTGPVVGWFIGRRANLRIGVAFAVSAATIIA